MSNNTNISTGALELARLHLETLAEELDAGRGLRVAFASHLMTRDDFADLSAYDSESFKDLAYELRTSISNYIGDELADQDDEDGMYGIPALTSFVALRVAYGQNWARLAYIDYVVHFGGAACDEPEAVANAVVERAEREYTLHFNAPIWRAA